MPKEKHLSIRVNRRLTLIENRVVEYKFAEIVSLNSLVEAGEDYEDEHSCFEEAVSHADMLDRLYHALQTLNSDEYKLIDALFFSNNGEGMSERAFAKISGIPRKTIEYRRRKTLDKLKHFLQG